MAASYGVNYTKANRSVPVEIIAKGETSGTVLVAYDEITLAAELANADTISLCRIPKGARVHSVSIVCPTLGATGTVNIGTAGSASAFASAVAVSGGDINKNFISLAVMSQDEILTLTATAATTAGIGKKVQVAVYYTLV